MDPNFWNKNTFQITYNELCQNALMESTQLDSGSIMQDGLAYNFYEPMEVNLDEDIFSMEIEQQSSPPSRLDEPMDVELVEERVSMDVEKHSAKQLSRFIQISINTCYLQI